MIPQEKLHLIWTLISLSLVPVTVIYLVLFKKMTSHLAKHHTEMYEMLGSAGLIRNNNIQISSRFMKFLLTRQYAEANDEKLIKVGNQCRLLLILGLFLFLIAFLLPIIIGQMSN